MDFVSKVCKRCIRLLSIQKTTVFLMGHCMKQYILVRVKLDKKCSGIQLFQEVAEDDAFWM